MLRLVVIADCSALNCRCADCGLASGAGALAVPLGNAHARSCPHSQVVRFTAPVAVQASAWEQVVSSWGPAEEVRPRRQLKRHAQVPEDS